MTSESISAPPERPNERLKGILCLAVGVCIFTVQDIVIKWLSGAYPIAEALAIRCVVAYPFLLLILHVEVGFAGLRTRRLGRLLARGALLFVSYTCFYLALAALPMAEATALFYSGPLFIVALSGPFLKEKVGLGRWLAVIFGFVGVIVICQPGGDIFDWAALLSLASAALYACGQVIARDLGRTERASVMAFYHNSVNFAAALLVGLLLGHGAFAGQRHASLEFLLRAWVVPGWFDLLLLASTGVVAAVAFWLLTQAYRIAEANVVAPFEYSSITWAVLWGYLFWREVPSPATAVGVVMIILAGLAVLRTARRPG